MKIFKIYVGNGFAAAAQAKGRRGTAAFTLVEALIASGVTAIFVAACLSAIFFNQIATRKAKQEAIAMDFLTQYVEYIKALPFDSVASGQPINSLYDGQVHSGVTYPLISLPADTNWFTINTIPCQIFCPDLLWLTNSDPQMKVILRTTSVGGSVHDKQINAVIGWDSPLGKGARMEVQVDILRTVNVPTL